MMKKRLVAFGLAGVMLMGMSMNVLAENISQGDSTQSVNTTITGKIPDTYTINIPGTLKENEDLTFSASNINLATGAEVKVKLATSGNLMMYLNGKTSGTASDKEQYQINLKLDGNDDNLTTTDEILSLNNSNSFQTITDKKVKVVIGEGVRDSLQAGTYTGTVNFAVSYAPASN